MITLRTQIAVAGVTGNEIIEFLLNCTDAQYRTWWPGAHLSFHTIERVPGDVGNVVMMDEFVGARRVRARGVVTEVERGKRLAWRLRKLINLPVRLTLKLDQDGDDVQLTHTVEAGFNGIGRILDPLFRLYFSPRFARALDEHVRIEFPKLRRMLRMRNSESTSRRSNMAESLSSADIVEHGEWAP
jgi:hypothetical protein